MTRPTPGHPALRPVPATAAGDPLPPAAPATGTVADDAVDVIEPRIAEGIGFFLKARANGRTYRVAPARDPRQPRFWCILVYRCSSAGVADPDERPWIGPGGMTREELPAALAAIRADVGAWLAQEPCRELREWLLSPAWPAAVAGTTLAADAEAAQVVG